MTKKYGKIDVGNNIGESIYDPFEIKISKKQDKKDEHKGKQRMDAHYYPGNQEEERKVKQNTASAMAAAQTIMKTMKEAGKIPAELQMMIDKLVEAKISWKDIIANILSTTMIQDDFSYRRTNPTYREMDVYVPTLSSQLKRVVVIQDTSGSVFSQKEQSNYLSELREILTMAKTTFISIDTEVKGVVEDVDSIEVAIESVKGGGGTIFAPAFKWIEDNLVEDCVCILMTDGYNDDDNIEMPWCVKQMIVLTSTGEKAKGFEADITITLEVE